MKVAWLAPARERCGISDYTDVLYPEVARADAATFQLMRFQDGTSFDDLARSVEALKVFSPNVIHLQHEYGLFGGKNPPWNQFPNWFRVLRSEFPKAKLVATAHTVLDPEYRYPMQGSFVSRSVRQVANLVLVDFLRNQWGPGTWGGFDRVIVHSRHQLPAFPTGQARVIPHFVPHVGSPSQMGKDFVVFGFFTPDKGQDIAIQAYADFLKQHPGTSTNLVLAGGLRREEDSFYFDQCKKLISDLKLQDRVLITGYLPDHQIDAVFDRALLVIAPFRTTSGSGSIVHAFARRKAVLASDLILNRELDERVPGCLDFFQSEDSSVLALAMGRVANDLERVRQLEKAGSDYARIYSVAATAQSHREFYREL